MHVRSIRFLLLALALWLVGSAAPASPEAPDVEPKDPLTGWYWNIDPETGEAVGMVSIAPAGNGYFITWDYTPEVEGKEIKRKQVVGQGKRRADVLSVVWGMGQLSTYEIKGRKIEGDGELWLPVTPPKFVSFIAAPAPPPKKEEPQAPELLPAPVVCLPEWCMWGQITQRGRHFVLSGEMWSATGIVMADSRVQVQWVSSTGALACGVYTMSGGGGVFDGLWGYDGECEILPNGNIVGTLMNDRLAPVAPPKAEGPDL